MLARLGLGLVFVGLMSLFSITPAFGQDLASLSPETVGQLTALRNSIITLDDNVSAGIITTSQRDAGVERYLVQASRLAGREVTKEDLFKLQVEGAAGQRAELTPLQKFAGLITPVNILWIFAIIGVVGCGTYLFGDLVVNISKDLPQEVYEAVLYIAGAVLVSYGRSLSPEVGPYVGLTGCLMLAGALALTNYLHKLKVKESYFFTLLFAVWGMTALVYQSQMIGFIAVGAMMAALGFSAAVYPFVVVLGFEDEDSLGKGTAAAFGILSVYTGLIVFNAPITKMEVFRNGSLFLGSFVGYLGLLIASTRWYDTRSNYGILQIITILAGISAIFIGSVYGIGELQKIGGTFFVLYLLTKLSEIPARSMRGYAVLGLFTSAIVYGFCLYVKSNPDLFRPYLFMFS